MRLLLVCALPFHRWVLKPLADAAEAAGHAVAWWTHTPKHAHHWLHTDGAALTACGAAARAHGAQATVVADYPYPPLRQACGVPVIATRHSLAGRRNTWEPEQAEADYLVTWGAWDHALLAARGITPRQALLPAGPVWADPLWEPTPAPASDAPVLWAPSLDAAFSRRDAVTAALARFQQQTGRQVVVRPHAATRWREPGWLVQLASQGLQVEPPEADLAGPCARLATCAALIGDVSGIVTLAAIAHGGALPIVQIEPPPGSAPQRYDPAAPEWALRYAWGPRLSDPADLPSVLTAVLANDGHRSSRQQAIRTLVPTGRAAPRLLAYLAPLLETANAA